MDRTDLEVVRLVDSHLKGRLSRRRFSGRLLALGLSLPAVATLVEACSSSNNNAAKTATVISAPAPSATTAGSASTARPSAAAATVGTGPSAASPTPAAASTFNPTKRGGGGLLKVLYWQAPSLLNPHLTSGGTSLEVARLAMEPLARWDPQAKLVPVLATEIPSVAAGTLDPGLKSVTWKLRKDVLWQDGQPFTADDVVFTWQYVTDPATAAVTVGAYRSIDSVEKVDASTVKITFKGPTPFWAGPFTGRTGAILPMHLEAQYKGAQSRNSPQNLKPVGTGPYRITDFRPNDAATAELNDKYYLPNRPFFDRLEIKGGGDPASGVRAVLQTGEYDYAFNIRDAGLDVLQSVEKSGNGTIARYRGASTDVILVNHSDPNTEVNGEKSSPQSQHPFLGDLQVRKAFAMAIDRKTLTTTIRGDYGAAASYFLYNPERLLPSIPGYAYDPRAAGDLLDAAGWKKGGDGVRTKDGKRMHVVLAASQSSALQDMQQLLKKDLSALGIDVELKSSAAGVFYGPGSNPDSWQQFTSDLELFNSGSDSPDPITILSIGTTAAIAQKSNNWSGINAMRYKSTEYDQLWSDSQTQTDDAKRTAAMQRMNQLLESDVAMIPLSNLLSASAFKKDLKDYELTAWDANASTIAFWHR